MTIAKTISWSKWYNPWDHEHTNFKEEADVFEEEVGTYKDSFEEHTKKQQTGNKVLVSPLGAITVLTPRAIEELMNFWIGNTNFKLSVPLCKIIEGTDGVESFEVISPYRMRVAFAQLFKPGTVIHAISNNITEYFNTLEIQDTPKVKDLSTMLSDRTLLTRAPWLVRERNVQNDQKSEKSDT